MKNEPVRSFKKIISNPSQEKRTSTTVESFWQDAVDIIAPYVVKIDTPRGMGTGFLCAHTKNKKYCGIATALHVVDESHRWEEPIRISQYNTKKEKLLHVEDRAIWSDRKKDAAVILTETLPFLPTTTLNIMPGDECVRVGVEIGWVGFPVVYAEALCFFTGKISSWQKQRDIYLVDGVAINGVSGGPAFNKLPSGVLVVGVVTAYLPNRQAATPGLAVISDVCNLKEWITSITNIDEAVRREKDKPSGTEPGK